jgi:hypothetical protein
MRVAVYALALLVTLSSPVPADVTVRVTAGLVDITARTAPLREVLDCLARQSGMKVVYDGPAPRQLVTVSVSGRSSVEAVQELLEGQGLNYALMGDAAGTGVQTLVVSVGPGARTASPSASGRVPSSADSVAEAEQEDPSDTPPAAALKGLPPALRELISPGQVPAPTPPNPSPTRAPFPFTIPPTQAPPSSGQPTAPSSINSPF